MTKKSPTLPERPDVTGLGSFRTERGFAERFECAFFLPASETAKMWALVRPHSPGDSPVILDWKFSCELVVGTDVIAAEQIFHSGYVSWDWGQGSEETLVGELTRLTVRRGDALGSRIVRSRFMITRSALLRSADFVSQQSGVMASRKVVRRGPVCRVSADIAFRFSSTYRRGPTGDVEWGVEGELVDPAAMEDAERVLAWLDDVLTVASLAERQILILTGWGLEYANGAAVTSYRRDFTIPVDEETDVDAETLVSLQDIEEFLNQSLARLVGLPHPGALKQAIQFALHGQARGIGDSFVMLFAGIETLLNLFVSKHDLEPIVPKKQWRPWFDRMSATLEAEKDFQALTADTRTQLLDNVRGANRALFGDRFRRMCSSQKIDLGDLWPMLGGQGSLYAVRNRIVHGRVFANNQEWFRVVSAKHHLLWTLERSILGILAWPIDRSRVSSQALRNITLFNNWRADRDYFLTAK